MIRMTHPDLPEASAAVASEKAFERIWEPKGWQLVEDTPAVEVPSTAPPAPRPTPPSPTPSVPEG